MYINGGFKRSPWTESDNIYRNWQLKMFKIFEFLIVRSKWLFNVHHLIKNNKVFYTCLNNSSIYNLVPFKNRGQVSLSIIKSCMFVNGMRSSCLLWTSFMSDFFSSCNGHNFANNLLIPLCFDGRLSIYESCYKLALRGGNTMLVNGPLVRLNLTGPS